MKGKSSYVGLEFWLWTAIKNWEALMGRALRRPRFGAGTYWATSLMMLGTRSNEAGLWDYQVLKEAKICKQRSVSSCRGREAERKEDKRCFFSSIIRKKEVLISQKNLRSYSLSMVLGLRQYAVFCWLFNVGTSGGTAETCALLLFFS